MDPLIADRTLAQRLELAEALANCAFVEARARRDPSTGACWIEVAGARAMFDGPSSPCTQSFGLGLFEPVRVADLEQIEAFFQERGAPVHLEISPLADPALFALLAERKYVPFEFTTVMALKLDADRSGEGEKASDVSVSVAGPDEVDIVASTAALGWGIAHDFSLVSDRTVSFLGRIDGEPVAAGSVVLCEGVALLAGASTVPHARNRGAQRSLLSARLSYAARNGCALAMIGAEPGSASQRNSQREGFQIVYTRMKWRTSV
jgi:GNAT superfamily N-acetyltransferase